MENQLISDIWYDHDIMLYWFLQKEDGIDTF